MANTTQNHIQLPGRLEGQFSITLDSFEAVLALRGRRRTPDQEKICGLYEFSSRLSMIYSAAELGDPFAIYGLVQIEDKIRETERAFTKREKKLAKTRQHKSSNKVTYAIPRSVSPLEFNLSLAHYGASVARILVRYDNLILDIKNQMHLNMLPPREGKQQISDLGLAVRALLDAGVRYNYTSCRKKDLEQRNQLGDAAVKKLLGSQFIDRSKFKSDDEIFEYFATYPFKPKYGPATVVSDQVFADRAKRAGNTESKAKSRYAMFLPRAPKATADKSSKEDKSSKGPFKGREREKSGAEKPVVEKPEPVKSVKKKLEKPKQRRL